MPRQKSLRQEIRPYLLSRPCSNTTQHLPSLGTQRILKNSPNTTRATVYIHRWDISDTRTNKQNIASSNNKNGKRKNIKSLIPDWCCIHSCGIRNATLVDSTNGSLEQRPFQNLHPNT